MTKIIAFGSDHAGFELKETLKTYVASLGYEIKDYGTHNDDSTDYPIYGKRVGEAIRDHEADLGIAICGTGIGISLAANKVEGVRAAPVSDAFSAEYARRHNDANILAMGSRVVGPGLAEVLVKTFLDAEFEGGRHQRRVDEIKAEDARDDAEFEALVQSGKSAKPAGK